jgi:hypothetical protein
VKALIVNHDKKECGTFQYAKRIWEIVTSDDIAYVECVSREGYLSAIQNLDPEYVIINWHKDRIDWLLESDITDDRKYYFLFHDGSIFNKYDKYIFCGELPNYPTAVPEEKSILLPRPVLKYFGGYPINDIPTIGSFGFPTDHKRFPELVTKVNKEFDKAHIRLHMPSPYFGVTAGYNLPKIVKECHANNTNPGVTLNISSNFVDDQTLLKFLAGNDINVFYYEYLKNPGISSAIDYALSVRRPFAVTRNNLFRHVSKDEILLENNTIADILERGTEPFEEFYEKWNPDIFRREFNEMCI